MALEYVDMIYRLSEKLPREEDYILKQQVRRAATSIALNIAEGSTGQSDPEQSRFLGMALRSLIETVACQHLLRLRKYEVDASLLEQTYAFSETLAKKIQSMRRSLSKSINHDK
jgi:four helix bundle protein